VESPRGKTLKRQLRRQSLWLRDSYIWLLKTKVIKERSGMSALDVGCGPGFVMEALKGQFAVAGIDVDDDMVRTCRSRGLDVQKASAYRLPYRDNAFDVVYCTFLLLWLKGPSRALEEMARVSRSHVLCLAEPDLGARIDHPESLADLGRLLVEGMRAQRGDPFIGRKLRELCEPCGLVVEVGVHPGVWDIQRLREEYDDEWRYVESTASTATKDELRELRHAWREALSRGSLFQYNPIFYALGRKH